MNASRVPGRCQVVLVGLAFSAILTSAGSAHASEFAWFEGDVVGTWKNSFAVGAAWRNTDAHSQLIGAGAGNGLGGAEIEFPGASGGVGVNDDGNLNFGKNDMVAAPISWTSELTLRHKSGQGIFVRVNAWYDMRVNDKNMSHGSGPTAFVRDVKLDDSQYLDQAQLKGVDIYDAFFFGNYELGTSTLSLRLGRQAIQWGESVLYPGVNSYNPYDYARLKMPGAKVLNGGQLPVNRLYLGLTLDNGWAFDGFLNLEFRGSVTPGCGTYFSTLDNGFHPGCNLATAAGLADEVSIQALPIKNYYNSILYPGGAFPNGGPDAENSSTEPSKWSGWGVSAHKFIERWGVDVGAYYTTYTNPFPINSPVVGTDALTFGINTMFADKKVQNFALSASGGVRSLTMFGQASFTKDLPSQRNAPAFIGGALTGTGPYGFMQDLPNQEVPGYFPLDIAKGVFGASWQFGELLRLPNALLTAEANLQWVTNHPGLQGPNAERLGRYGNFGVAAWDQEGYVCDPGPLDNGIINNCDVDGFVTDFAAGYKIRASAVIPKPGTGLVFAPVLVFSHDVSGYSADGGMLEGRLSLGAYLRVVLRQKYYIEGGVVVFDRGNTMDPLADRGQYSLVFGANL